MRESVCYESGHGGYTGTIAEKSAFTVRYPSESALKELEAEAKIRLTEKRAAVQAAPIDKVKSYSVGNYNCANEEQRTARLKRIDDSLTPEGLREAALYAWARIDQEKNEKWGPAFCLVLREASTSETGLYLFYGWASS